MEPKSPLHGLVSDANSVIDGEMEQAVIDKAVARIDYARQKTGRSCGSCSMCCYMMGVEALDKPKYRWCQHCKTGKGCSIYANPDYAPHLRFW
jgi:MinD superfamily P-loop ATPase